MQSTGHSSMQPLSSTSTHGSAITYVTSAPAPHYVVGRGPSSRGGDTRPGTPPGSIPVVRGARPCGGEPIVPGWCPSHRWSARAALLPGDPLGGRARGPLEARALAAVARQRADHRHVGQDPPEPPALWTPAELL